MNTTAMAAKTITIITQADTPLGLGVGFCCFAVFGGGWVSDILGGARDGVVVGDVVVVCVPYKISKNTINVLDTYRTYIVIATIL